MNQQESEPEVDVIARDAALADVELLTSDDEPAVPDYRDHPAVRPSTKISLPPSIASGTQSVLHNGLAYTVPRDRSKDFSYVHPVSTVLGKAKRRNRPT